MTKINFFGLFLEKFPHSFAHIHHKLKDINLNLPSYINFFIKKIIKKKFQIQKCFTEKMTVFFSIIVVLNNIVRTLCKPQTTIGILDL